jgi:hypothetical protein
MTGHRQPAREAATLLAGAAENTNSKVCDVGKCAGINSCGLALFSHEYILPERDQGANRMVEGAAFSRSIGQKNRRECARPDDLRVACYHACDTKRHTDMNKRDFSDILCQSFI